MELMKQMILEKGLIENGDVLKVGSFLNHQIDVKLIKAMGEELYRLFKDDGVNKILTIESSGIAIASFAALAFGCDMVFAKKSKSINLSGESYVTKVRSFTHLIDYEVVLTKDFLNPDDRVLIVDDFLANGNALIGLLDICKQAGATVVGCGIAIEKEYQGGGQIVRDMGIRVESMAKIKSMSVENGVEFSE